MMEISLQLAKMVRPTVLYMHMYIHVHTLYMYMCILVCDSLPQAFHAIKTPYHT